MRRLDIESAPDQSVALWDPDAFRADPDVDFDAETMPIRPALALSAVTKDVRRGWESAGRPGWLTWFGGPPAVRRGADVEWPRDADGRPLAHVVQVDLGAERLNHREARFAKLPLPSSGIVQLFHDLTSYGDEESDPRSWRVRRIPKREGEDSTAFVSAEPPADIEPGRVAPLSPINTEVVPTAPSFLDAPLPRDSLDRDRYERVYYWIEEYPHLRNVMRRKRDDNPFTPWQKKYTPSDPVSRMGGFPTVEANPDYVDELHAGLPLRPGDAHALLLEILPSQFDAPGDWCHGLRPLQVWIRASDLADGRLDDVWCQIRTDG